MLVVTSRRIPATRPSTARCAATSRSAVSTTTRRQHARRTRSARTAPSSSGRASRSVVAQSFLTSTACRRPHTGVPSRLPTPAIGGWFVMGYTAQFGNGFSATIAAEAPPHDADRTSGTVGAARSLPAGAALRRRLSRGAPTVASRCLTLSATCASTRHGVRPRSWVPCMRSMRRTTDYWQRRSDQKHRPSRTTSLAGWSARASS